MDVHDFTLDVRVAAPHEDAEKVIKIRDEVVDMIEVYAVLFGEYGQWWVYHQKDDTVKKNTANHTLLRLGLRYGF